MTKEIVIEDLRGRGMTAKVTVDGERFLVGDDGLEITEPLTELTPYELSQLSLTELLAEVKESTEYVDEIHSAIRRKMYAEGFEEGRRCGLNEARVKAEGWAEKLNGFPYKDNINPPSIDDLMNLGKEVTKTPQERRDEIVEQAKADVEDLKVRMISDTFNDEGSVIFRVKVSVVNFVVNKKKRTIVAIVKGAYGLRILDKGIAKCAPGDCFNVHIGKAIALRRALGLKVPVEYINTPQPTEVREGDIIRWKWGGRS